MPEIILASRSKARQAMLHTAGLDFEVIPAETDERALEEKHIGSPETLAQALAEAKALEISGKYPDGIVIAADQILELGGEILHKAENTEQAREKLCSLRNRTHSLISAVTIAQNGQITRTMIDRAELTMHDFDNDFLDWYIEKAGPELTTSVGAYALEGRGAWLFEKIEGDYFTVLGMPLLQLLGYLRKEKLVRR